MWIVWIGLACGPGVSDASPVVPLPASSRTELRTRVRAYLGGGASLAQFKATPVDAVGRVPAALIAIEEATQALEDHDPAALVRARDVTSFAAHLLERESLTPRQRRLLHGYLSVQAHLLKGERFRLIRVLELFNRHDLWTARDFMTVSHGLRTPAHRRLLFRTFVQVRPLLSDDDLATVRALVEPLRSGALDHLALLAEFEALRPAQIQLLFKRLAAAMTSPAAPVNEYPREARFIQLRALWQLNRLFAREPAYRAAFARASRGAMGFRQIRFYRRFAAGTLRGEFDEDSWREDPLRLAGRRDDVVVDLDACRDALKIKR